MSKQIEYRVRAVTRYVVTQHEGSTQEVGEFTASELASGVAAALALARRERGDDAVFVPYEGPPPGKAMRCKLVMIDKKPYASLQWGGEAKGRTEPRTNDQGREYIWVDPGDPANYVVDGEFVDFAAVWGGQAADGANAVRENRIFSDATPSFRASGHIRNQGALAALAVGQEYYVDFIPAPKTAGAS